MISRPIPEELESRVLAGEFIGTEMLAVRSLRRRFPSWYLSDDEAKAQIRCMTIEATRRFDGRVKFNTYLRQHLFWFSSKLVHSIYAPRRGGWQQSLKADTDAIRSTWTYDRNVQRAQISEMVEHLTPTSKIIWHKLVKSEEAHRRVYLGEKAIHEAAGVTRKEARAFVREVRGIAETYV